jgi:phosphoribosyl 1,2-cyclic phosphodiesterase
MSLYIASLNSGSNGNCYYIGNGKDAVLIDAGISCRETEKRMARLGLLMKNVRAVFITHEHIDHIKGVDVLAKKYNIPVYITDKTLSGCRLSLPKDLVKSFSADVPVMINKLYVTPFAKVHDAAEPHSFVVEGNGVSVGVFTDLGIACENLVYHFGRCHAAFLEANYDSNMLEYGRYPMHLKSRIRGGKGHLSNEQALKLFRFHRSEKLSHLLLAHLSNENNNPDLVAGLFTQHANGVNIVIASRFAETAVYHIVDKARPQDSIAVPELARQATLF